jgi:predicted transcriptional regulator of viral defense system
MLSDPQLGGGIRSTVDMFNAYLKSENKNMDLLIDYAKRFENGAVYKRLGFLLERVAPEEQSALKACTASLTTGTAKLDPKLPADKLVTRWRLWIPQSWVKES